MTAVDEALARVDMDRHYSNPQRDPSLPDRIVLAAEVRKLREQLADCRKGITRWEDKK